MNNKDDIFTLLQNAMQIPDDLAEKLDRLFSGELEAEAQRKLDDLEAQNGNLTYTIDNLVSENTAHRATIQTLQQEQAIQSQIVKMFSLRKGSSIEIEFLSMEYEKILQLAHGYDFHAEPVAGAVGKQQGQIWQITRTTGPSNNLPK